MNEQTKREAMRLLRLILTAPALPDGGKRTPPRKGPTTARDFVEQPKIRQIRRMA